MLRFIVAVVAVGTVWGQAAESSSPKYCCTPPQWEGIQAGEGGYVAGGHPQALTTVAKVAFDRNGRRIYAFTNTTAGSTVSSVKVIQDYKSGYQFVIDVKKQTCTKTKLTQPFNEGCIPNDARFMGDYTIGAGTEMVKIKSYAAEVKSKEANLGFTVSVTEKQCIPISENFIGSSNNVPMVVLIGFVNVVPEIKDPSVFNPPSICGKFQNTTVKLPPSHVAPEFHILHL